MKTTGKLMKVAVFNRADGGTGVLKVNRCRIDPIQISVEAVQTWRQQYCC